MTVFQAGYGKPEHAPITHLCAARFWYADRPGSNTQNIFNSEEKNVDSFI